MPKNKEYDLMTTSRLKVLALAIPALLALSVPALAQAPSATQAPETTARRVSAVPRCWFVGLKDGDTVKSPLDITFGSLMIEIAPAGTTKPGTGHFHLLIDTALTADQAKAPIPNDAQHMHFGKGQTEVKGLVLTPGKHTLQLVIADGAHVPLNPPVESDKITVTVK
jgi:hypothetical protein